MKKGLVMKSGKFFCFWSMFLSFVCQINADEIILPSSNQPNIYLPPRATTLVQHEQESRAENSLNKIEHMICGAKKRHMCGAVKKKLRCDWSHEKRPCREPIIWAMAQQQNTAKEEALLIADVYSDVELVQKKISLNIKKMSIKKVIEAIDKLSGMSFVVDANVLGTVEEVRVHEVPVAIALQLILNSAQPRLGLVKTCGVWRVMLYNFAVEFLRARQQQASSADYVSSFYTIQHAKWDEKFKIRMERLWDGVVGDQKGKPGTFLAFDDSSKKVFFKGHTQQVHDFEVMLKEIDLHVQQVRLDIRVIIADKNFEEMLGFQWGGRYDRKTTSRRLVFDSVGGAVAQTQSTHGATTPFGAITDWSLNLIPGWKGSPTALGAFANKEGIFSMPFIFRNADYSKLLNLTLNAAENRHEIKTLLKPSLLVNSEESAEILVGESMPLQTKVAESVGSNIENVTTTQYKDLGIKVNVKPIVSPNNASVFLDIFLENSALSLPSIDTKWMQNGTTETLGYTIKTSRSKNRVLLRSGQTTLISGLIVNSSDNMKNGVPFLKDLPILGALFRGTKKVIEDKQLLIFITPIVI
jgi:type IV pilus assembly protein PilQ